MDKFYRIFKVIACCIGLVSAAPSFSQIQSCPANINFASGDISFWSATTGLVNGGTQSYPAPNTLFLQRDCR
jgi:hypothetical protein